MIDKCTFNKIVKKISIKTIVFSAFVLVAVSFFYFVLANILNEDLIYEFYNLKTLYYLFVYIICEGVIVYSRYLKNIYNMNQEENGLILSKCDLDIKLSVSVVLAIGVLSVLLIRAFPLMFWAIYPIVLFVFLPYMLFCIILKREIKSINES